MALNKEEKFDVESIEESCEQIRCFLQRYGSNERSNLRGFTRIELLRGESDLPSIQEKEIL